MLATPLLNPEAESPKGDQLVLEPSKEDLSAMENQGTSLSSDTQVDLSHLGEFQQFQRGSLVAILLLSLSGSALTALFWGMHIATSLLCGGLSGALYLWLLARSVGKLGKSSQSVGKVQLLVPIVLFLAAVKLPQLDLFPAILGFLLYKPSMILQVFLSL